MKVAQRVAMARARWWLQVVLALLAACGDDDRRTIKSSRAEWLEPRVVGPQVMFVEARRGLVAGWPPDGRPQRLPSDFRAQNAAVLGSALVILGDDEKRHASGLEVIRARASTSTNQDLARYGGGGDGADDVSAPQSCHLEAGYDLLSASDGSFVVAYSDARYQNSLRGRPGDFAVAHVNGTSCRVLQIGPALSARVARAADEDFPVQVSWYPAVGEPRFLFVLYPSDLQIVRIEGGERGVVYHIDLRDADTRTTFAARTLVATGTTSDLELFVRSESRSDLFRIHLTSTAVDTIERVDQQGPVRSLAADSAHRVALLANSKAEPVHSELTLYSPGMRPVSRRLDGVYGEVWLVPGEKDAALVIALEAAPISRVAYARWDDLVYARGTGETFRSANLTPPALHVVRLERELWFLHADGAASVLEVANLDMHRLPFERPFAPDTAPVLGKVASPDDGRNSEVVWALSADRARVLAIVAASRQELVGDLEQPVDRLVALGGPMPKLVAMHPGALPVFSTLKLAGGSAGQASSLTVDQQSFFLLEELAR